MSSSMIDPNTDFINPKVHDDIKDHFSNDIKKSVNVLNRISGKEVIFPTSFIPLDKKLVQGWANDILKLKEMICSLGLRMGSCKEEYLELLNFNPEMLRYLEHDNLEWVSSFFRPDCILTKDGPKILEFNIDNGSMAFIAGLSPKGFYKNIKGLTKFISEKYNTTLDNSIWSEETFVKYFNTIKELNKDIYLWDISGRSETIASERSRELSFFKNSGIKIDLIEGEDIENKISSNAYFFRYFAYIHFFNEKSGLKDLYFKFSNQTINNSDMSVSSLLYDNKINLALLWDGKIQKYLDSKEQELVKKYIPRSIINIGHDNNKEDLEVIRKKNQWTIKKGISFQGKDVSIGQDIDNCTWRTLVDKAIKEQNSIFQESVSHVTIPIELTNGNNVFAPEGTHVMNFYYVNNTFSGLLFRINRYNNSRKVGAIDSSNVIVALPLLIDC